MFKDELFAGDGDVVIYMNSPGGDCIAASQIYTMLMDYPGNVTIKIDGIAASAASVIAMAGTSVLMAPTSLMMIHNPMTAAFGSKDEMEKAIEMLEEVKESIINAYELRTGLSRARISHLMDSETWMNANRAIELGFADGMLTDEKIMAEMPAFEFSDRAVEMALINKITQKTRQEKPPESEDSNPKEPVPRGRSVDELMERLSLLKN
jgi:ATP-dependent Clp protease protease subunit